MALAQVAKKPKPKMRALVPPELTVEQRETRELMLHLARKMGYVCQRMDGIRADIGQAIYSRMSNRVGKAIYQQICIAMPCPRDAAEQLFSPNLKTDSQSAARVEWRASTMAEARELIGNLLSGITDSASCLTRAVQPPSEKVVRVFSTLMPPIEVSHTVHEHGRERLHLNATYVLFNNSGDVHPPKDAHRNEMALSTELEGSLRQQVLQDVHTLSEQGVPLSAAWWRQLGREETAEQVEQGLISASQRAQAAARAAAALSSAQARAALRAPQFNIDRIVKEVKTTGAAKIWFLVRWEGYDVSWEAWRISGEVGDPLETWEPLRMVRQTEAYSSWQAAKLEAAAAQ